MGDGKKTQRQGLLLGATAILIFSFTLPATRMAVPVFGGWTVGIGRAAIAGVLAGLILRIAGSSRPSRSQCFRIAWVSAGVVFGFPVFTALAMEHVPASRGAIVIGVLPAATALVATLRHRERPSTAFWVAALAGMLTVVVFAVITGAQGRPEPADALLFFAVAAAAIGYAEGAALSSDLGGWQTICWALVLSLPITIPTSIGALWSHGVVEPSALSILGFAYVSVFSMFLGFFAWYGGLGRGGTARISQLQLTQPVLTLGWAALLLDETISAAAVTAAALVIVFVALSRKAKITRG